MDSNNCVNFGLRSSQHHHSALSWKSADIYINSSLFPASFYAPLVRPAASYFVKIINSASLSTERKRKFLANEANSSVCSYNWIRTFLVFVILARWGFNQSITSWGRLGWWKSCRKRSICRERLGEEFECKHRSAETQHRCMPKYFTSHREYQFCSSSSSPKQTEGKFEQHWARNRTRIIRQIN